MRYTWIRTAIKSLDILRTGDSNRMSRISTRLASGFILGFALIIISSCGGSGGHSESEPQDSAESHAAEPLITSTTGQGLLGPLVGAEVKVYALGDRETPIHSDRTTDADTLSDSGTFSIPLTLLEDDNLYLITVSGGSDIDADDDGIPDESPTENRGTLHLVASGEQLKYREFTVNILTEAVYRKISDTINESTGKDELNELYIHYAGLLLQEDITGDGAIDLTDLLAWNPVTDRDRLMQEWDHVRTCIRDIHADTAESLESEERFNGLFVYRFLYLSEPVEIGPFVVGQLAGDVPLFGSGATMTSGSFSTGYYSESWYTGSLDDNPGLFVTVGDHDADDNSSGDDETGDPGSIDLTRPEYEHFTGGLNLPGTSDKVAVQEHIAFVACGNEGLQIVDAGDPTAPAVIRPTGAPTSMEDIAVFGDHAFIADENAWFVTLDISNLDDPFIVSMWDFPGEAYDVAIDGDYAYMATGISGVKTLDISDPAAPVLAGSGDTPGFALSIALAGDYAYAADVDSGLAVIDIHNPIDPFAIHQLPVEGGCWDVAIFEELAVLAAGSAGLQVVDISTPEAPVIISRITAPQSAYIQIRLHPSGQYAVVRDLTANLEIIDISDPYQPTVVETITVPGGANDFAIAGDFLYITNGQGLLLYRVTGV